MKVRAAIDAMLLPGAMKGMKAARAAKASARAVVMRTFGKEGIISL